MEPYLGQIQAFAFNFVPDGWALCDGSSLNILEHQALYALLGTRFGGTSSTFNLPDLRGRVPIGYYPGQGCPGLKGGVETVALTSDMMPSHNHTVKGCSSEADYTLCLDSIPGATDEEGAGAVPIYRTYIDSNQISLAGGSVSAVGADSTHANVQPFAAVQYCIAIEGCFPPRA